MMGNGVSTYSDIVLQMGGFSKLMAILCIVNFSLTKDSNAVDTWLWIILILVS